MAQSDETLAEFELTNVEALAEDPRVNVEALANRHDKNNI